MTCTKQHTVTDSSGQKESVACCQERTFYSLPANCSFAQGSCCAVILWIYARSRLSILSETARVDEDVLRVHFAVWLEENRQQGMALPTTIARLAAWQLAHGQNKVTSIVGLLQQKPSDR